MAGPASDALGTCMVDSLNGKERKELAQWIFFAMAAHPDIKKYAQVSKVDQLNTDEFVANLVTRLLTNDCAEQTRTAVKDDGEVAIKGAFEMVGKVAMQELISNKEVSASLLGYAKFLDRKKLADIMSPK